MNIDVSKLKLKKWKKVCNGEVDNFTFSYNSEKLTVLKSTSCHFRTPPMVTYNLYNSAQQIYCVIDTEYDWLDKKTNVRLYELLPISKDWSPPKKSKSF